MVDGALDGAILRGDGSDCRPGVESRCMSRCRSKFRASGGGCFLVPVPVLAETGRDPGVRSETKLAWATESDVSSGLTRGDLLLVLVVDEL